MTSRIRLAGHGRVGDAWVTWTIAEGERGRRWREVLTRDGAVIHSLLLETGPERVFSHLELSVSGVLVTLHPEDDGTLHGNRVAGSGAGVEHVEGLPFPTGSAVLVEGSPIGAAVVTWGRGPIGAVVDHAGRVRTATLGVLADAVEVDVDEQGVPHLLDAVLWQLERD